MRVEKKTARRQDGKTARRRHTDGHGQATRRGDACVARVPGKRVGGKLPSKHVIDPVMVEIRPEPSPSERAAILVALGQMLNATRHDEPPQPSAWALAGRRDSLLGSTGSSRTGWGRGSDRLEGW